jgi:hypothetical protein
MDEASPLGSTRILSLAAAKHQTLSTTLSSAAAGWELYLIQHGVL